jgi:hypothetical protein
MGQLDNRAQPDDAEINDIATWLARAAAGNGLSIKKVLDSPLDISASARVE